MTIEEEVFSDDQTFRHPDNSSNNKINEIIIKIQNLLYSLVKEITTIGIRSPKKKLFRLPVERTKIIGIRPIEKSSTTEGLRKATP